MAGNLVLKKDIGELGFILKQEKVDCIKSINKTAKKAKKEK